MVDSFLMVDSSWYDVVLWVVVVALAMGLSMVATLEERYQGLFKFVVIVGASGALISIPVISKCAFKGKPLPFDILKENQVYEVVEKMPETRMIFIKIKARDEKDGRIVEISEFFDELGKGERFVKIKGGIAKLP